jgi:acid phosphatase
VRLVPAAIAALLALVLPSAAVAHGHHGHDGVKRIVVIYEENHSFDNLYGGWEGVNGLANADRAHTTQVNQAGTPYTCLKQDDVNLATPPLPATCHDETVTPPFDSAFPNSPFEIDKYIAPSDTTCPAPGVSAPNGVAKGSGLPGGCTRDLVHRFYQEQYQLDGGKQDRYTTGSDAIGLTQGYYDTTALPVYKYLHAPGHPRYAIADDFFQGAFGGSFLNHQWLIAAATPTFPGAPADQHSVLDANGMPQRGGPTSSYPLYNSPADPATTLKDTALTAACPAPNGLACGDYAVNTIQPTYQPHGSGLQLPPQTAPTIGDRLSAKHVDWAWYSGGWSNANGDVGAPGWTNGNGPACSNPNTVSGATFPNCPDKLFQYHHQPFNYFASFGTDTAAGKAARKAHLRDEAEFEAAATASKHRCKLKPVSFIKPIGEENEHPGYASEHSGNSHLVDLLQAIEGSKCAKSTMVVVTYDEFGGQWDHVAPPGQGGAPGPHDQWGPSTRIPALVLSPKLRGDFVVDHTQYDTTSILATIEHRYGLKPLTSRDAAVNNLFDAFSAKPAQTRQLKGHHMHHGPSPKDGGPAYAR